MRRSVILITVILTLCVSLGVWMDVSQQRVAREYLDSVRLIRDLADGGQQEQACDEQRYLHAQWQHDAVWLNYLISHHHTRAVSAAMVELATALERRWDIETFQALDALEDALHDVEQSDFPYWENIL